MSFNPAVWSSHRDRQFQPSLVAQLRDRLGRGQIFQNCFCLVSLLGGGRVGGSNTVSREIGKDGAGKRKKKKHNQCLCGKS